MFEYRSEVLKTSVKWINDSTNEKDVIKLDQLINKRASEGWELVTHSYMVNIFGVRSAILVTFRKPK